jgi:hypothetical protein
VLQDFRAYPLLVSGTATDFWVMDNDDYAKFKGNMEAMDKYISELERAPVWEK